MKLVVQVWGYYLLPWEEQWPLLRAYVPGRALPLPAVVELYWSHPIPLDRTWSRVIDPTQAVIPG